MAASKRKDAAKDAAAELAIFDRAHLAHYTMNIPELETEVIGLFLVQLPETLKSIGSATTQAEWKLATHTLKGACASIGAKRLHALAVQLEATPFEDGAQARELRLKAAEAAAQDFREAVRPIYGQG